MSEFIIANVCLCCYKYKYLSVVSSIAIHNSTNLSVNIMLWLLKGREVAVLALPPPTTISQDLLY